MKKRRLVIAIDVGDTLLDRTKKTVLMKNGHDKTYELFDGAMEALELFAERGHKLVVVSKVSHGAETRVMHYLEHHHIVPRLIKRRDVHFCYEREIKAPIAQSFGVDVIVDDRVQVHNEMQKFGIKGILFLGGHDDRKEYKLTADVLEARNWLEVVGHINNLSQ